MATNLATQKATSLVTQEFAKLLEKFTKDIEKKWGKNAPTPSKKEYVKYTQDYKSMAKVDFDKGIITIQTIDTANTTTSLQDAITTTLLTPYNPDGVDLYSSKDIDLNGKPYLYGEVKDNKGRLIEDKTIAQDFAKYLTQYKMQTGSVKTNTGTQKSYYVIIAMEKDSENIRAKKYQDSIDQYSKKYGVSKSLIYAIIKTESNFNPYAVSSVPAFGLMQIVPQSAGKDVNKQIYNKNEEPTKNFLFDTKNNIDFGTAYLDILDTKYLQEIQNPTTREYCVISAYNTGSGNVLKVFAKDKNEAINKINSLRPTDVYNKLRTSLPYDETRRYLYKVTTAKKEFVNM